MMQEFLMKSFEEMYGSREGIEYFFAPGRVNLIGEHTDYNGGHVFPCALSFGTYVAARKREDQLIRCYSLNFKEKRMIEFPLANLTYEKNHDWANYPKGVIKFTEEFGEKIDRGFDLLYYGNIPNGAGLSSSASIELVTAVMLNDLFDLKMNMMDMVKICQRAENQFIGVNCGIMDQFAIGMGKEGCAILLDCHTLKYRYSSIQLDGYSIVIANTNKRRDLAESKYNERREECEAALFLLQKEIAISSLGELSEIQFEALVHVMEREVVGRRARHAVYENQRTLKAVTALEKNDLREFGKLMNQSHLSLRYNYEVTGEELDTLVELAWEQDGVVGSRMTGAGFGGCTVSIVENESVDNFMKEVGSKYKEKIGYLPSFYVPTISEGARKLEQKGEFL